MATRTRTRKAKVPTTRTDFGHTLRMLRGPRTLDQLEEASGVPKSALSRWERGLVWPEADRLSQVCIVLGVTPDQVLGFSPLPTDWYERVWFLGQASKPSKLSRAA